jgi:hypothetical protein
MPPLEVTSIQRMILHESNFGNFFSALRNFVENLTIRQLNASRNGFKSSPLWMNNFGPRNLQL